MRALSIRQPWAELILRGVKTVEYRSRSTRIIGERFWIYAAGKWPPRSDTAERLQMERATRIWSRDLAIEAPPPWMMTMMSELLLRRDLPTGVIVGSAIIEKVTPPDLAVEDDDGLFRWHLSDARRAATLRKPGRHPQPVWFDPF